MQSHYVCSWYGFQSSVTQEAYDKQVKEYHDTLFDYSIIDLFIITI